MFALSHLEWKNLIQSSVEQKMEQRLEKISSLKPAYKKRINCAKYYSSLLRQCNIKFLSDE